MRSFLAQDFTSVMAVFASTECAHGGSMSSIAKKLGSVAIVLATVVFALVAAEGALRLKNASMKNYDIEMWKYALKLKKQSDNPLIGHEHIPNKSAVLQSVNLRTNEWGLRGDTVREKLPNVRRILFLGSSVTLGWGVSEEETITSLIQEKFSDDEQAVEVLNAGIGNYNTPRYVERFFKRLEPLKPTDIVVHFVLRDAETLEAPRKNLLLRHSQLATTAWIVLSRYFSKFKEPSLEEHYYKVYEEQAPGFINMKRELKRLADYANANHVRLYLAMTPDIHDLLDYKYTAIHEKMKEVATSLGYTYVDFLQPMAGLAPEEIWAMPGDPHPNAVGHRKMADALYPILAQG